MRSPSIAPQGFDVDVYVVLDDFGKLGRSYREVDEEAADRHTVIRNLISGEYNDPVRIVAFNTAEGWARDVTEVIAREIHDRAARSGERLSPGLRSFIEREIGTAQRPPSLAAQMTNPDDPNIRRHRLAREDVGYTAWLLTGMALFIIAGVMVFAASMHDDTRHRPSATVPASPSPPTTTGSR